MRAVMVVVVGVSALASAAHAAPNVLDKPAFTATPAELLAAAKAAPAGTGDVVVLRNENDISYDARGRITSTWRFVFYVATKAGADNWDMLSSTWLPAYQDKPTVRARVIDASGKSTDLDQTRITDAPANDTQRGAPTDRRRLEVPLPRLAVGSVIEEQVTTIDREPLPGGGAVAMLDLHNPFKLESWRVRISAPQKLRTRAHGLTVKPRTEAAGGRQVVTYVGGPLPATDDYEYFIPADARPFRIVLGTPVASWTQIAREYRALVDKRIGEGPITLPADIPKGGGVDTVHALHAWVTRQVEHHDVDLDDTAPVPSTPADTLKRGTGDAKDIATLLVAALRQAGVKAHLALINVGPGPDLDRDLPGFNLFDHVIVRAQVGKTELWIDPSERLQPPGRLPWYDQGRLVLIVSDDTKALIPTPAPVATDNLIREVRTFQLAEAGGAKVTEVSHESGAFEAEQRSWWRDSRADALRKNLSDYMDDQLKAKLDSYTATNAEDLTKRFEVTVVGSDSARAYADREAIDLYLFPTDALKKLPDVLREPPERPKQRKYDFYIASPHIYEIENRFVVPPGFTLPAPAPEKKRALGPLQLVERQRIDGQQLVVTFRFEATKSRLSPTDVMNAQQAIAALRNEDAVHLVIPHTALALADKGTYRDAITEVNKLIKLHPKEALHHQQLAQVLLKAGACEPARRAARKAIEIEPKSADAHVVLAWVLQHDTFCHWLGFDHDQAGARAALEKARKLDPTHLGAAHDLAELLERNAKGRRFDTGADVRAAVAAWRAARAIDDNDDRRYAMVTALLWIGDGAEAEKVLRAMPQAERRDQLLTAAVALTGGVDAAVRTAASLGSGSRATNLTTAASLMFLMRRYDLMRALFAEVKSVPGGMTQEQMLKQMKRSDKPFKPGKTPQDAVTDMLVGELTERGSKLFWDTSVRDEMRGREGAASTAFKRMDLMSDGLLEDILHSTLQLTVEGDAAAWRVEVEELGTKAHVYVASDRGVPKIIGSAEGPQGVGRHVFRLLAKNDEKAAARLLDWLAKDAGPRAKSLHARRFTTLWGTNLPRTRKDIEVAAAVLVGKTDPARAIPVLAACKPSTKDGQFMCDWALADIYRDTGKWTELLDHSRDWLTRASSPVLPTAAQAYALGHLGKFDDADRLIAEALAKDPDNDLFVFTHANLAVGRGQIGIAVKRFEPLTKKSPPDDGALNNSAWLQLVDGSDIKGAVMIARKAVQLAPKEPHTANTLAAIEAELGELREANQHLAVSVEANNRTKPGDADLYVHARVLEQLGYADDAIAVYRRLKPKPRPSDFTPDAWQLAARRLKALGVKP